MTRDITKIDASERQEIANKNTKENDTRRQKTMNDDEIITGYKAFDPDFKCQEHEFEVGKTFEHNGELDPRSKGFRFCQNDPIAVFDYFDLVDWKEAHLIKLAQVSAPKKDTFVDSDDDDKCVTSKITIDKEITLDKLIKKQIKKAYNPNARGASIVTAEDASPLTDKRPLTKIISNKDHIGVALTHFCSTALASADRTRLASSGFGTGLFATGKDASLSSSGYCSKIYSNGFASSSSASGAKAQLRITGTGASVSSSGFNSFLNVTGNGASISASGDLSILRITGSGTSVSMSGNHSKLTVTGNDARMTAAGKRARITYKGKGGIISVLGEKARFKGSEGTLVLAATYNCRGEPTGGLVGRIGEDGLKPNTLYTVSDGEFVEVEA